MDLATVGGLAGGLVVVFFAISNSLKIDIGNILFGIASIGLVYVLYQYLEHKKQPQKTVKISLKSKLISPIIKLNRYKFHIVIEHEITDKDEVKKVKADEAAESVKETRDDVVATVNGEEIFRKELDRRLGVLKRMNQEVTRAVQIDVISRLAMKVLLNQFIEGQNIVVSDGEMQGRLEQIKYYQPSKQLVHYR